MIKNPHFSVILFFLISGKLTINLEGKLVLVFSFSYNNNNIILAHLGLTTIKYYISLSVITNSETQIKFIRVDDICKTDSSYRATHHM